MPDMKYMYATPKGAILVEVLISFLIFVVGITGSLALLMQSARVNTLNINRLTALNIAEDALEGVKNIRDTNWLIHSSNLRECWNFSPDTNEDGTLDSNDDACTADSYGQNNFPLGMWDKNGSNNRLRSFLVDFDAASSRWLLLPSPEYLDTNTMAFTVYSGSHLNGEAPNVSSIRDPQLYLTPDGRYTHDSSGNTPSMFYRTVDFYYIDNTGVGESQLFPKGADFADPTEAKGKDNRIRIVATVSWKHHFQNSDFVSLELETIITDYLDRTNWTD